MTVADRIKITAQIAILKEIALDYKGKTIDNVIQQLELRLAEIKSETIKELVIWLESQETKLPRY